MKRVCYSLMLLFLSSAVLLATPTYSHMFYLGADGGFFVFNVDGTVRELLCDQYQPNVTTEPYTALVATLADLTGTQLFRDGDPDALKKYQMVAILDLLAYASPALAEDIVWVDRFIVGGTNPPRNDIQRALFDWVQTQDPSTYNLTTFRIYANPLTQEQTGFEDQAPAPEPSGFLLLGAGLGASFLLRRRAGMRSAS